MRRRIDLLDELLLIFLSFGPDGVREREESKGDQSTPRQQLALRRNVRLRDLARECQRVLRLDALQAELYKAVNDPPAQRSLRVQRDSPMRNVRNAASRVHRDFREELYMQSMTTEGLPAMGQQLSGNHVNIAAPTKRDAGSRTRR